MAGEKVNESHETESKGRTALVVEGGGMRGVFSTGILDAFIKQDFNPFDLCIGVSAGASNLAAYLGKMYQRNFKVFTDYSLRPEFISMKKFVRGGHLMDIDWLWDITLREMPVDVDTLFSTLSEFIIGATEVNTGKSVYLNPTRQNFDQLMKASSAIPVIYRGFVEVDGVKYVDGGVTDSIPVIEAYRRGASKIMVLRSRPHSYIMQSSKNNVLTKWHLRRYPDLLQALENRVHTYQAAIEFMRNPPAGVEVIEVNPPDSFQTERLTKELSILKQDYQLGYDRGVQLMEDWGK
ncbi:patatin-like phospholipase family protein [Paenibacillus aceti]|uniref:patatin-like phospholipase family protein n=1 Tax=Paenibacillus aceti TaxID=1820010 RepID=UPI000EA07193|nr:patatin family protein [Paenibacillus aceti]